MVWITLVITSVTYYQIKDSWNLDMNTAILYSFLLGFGVAGLLVLSKPILSKITKRVTQFNKRVQQIGGK